MKGKKAKKVSTKGGSASGRNWRSLGIKSAVVVGFLGLLFYFKNWFVVGWINNQPIFKHTYSKEVNRLAGQRALDTLMTKKLILQEARKQKITVTDEELNQELAAIEVIAQQQEMTLDELLSIQKLNRSELMAEIRIQKLLEKMVGGVEVTEEEVQNYWEESKDFYPDQTFAEAQGQISAQLKQQKLSESIQAFISSLQEQAKVVSWL
jgi:foldase protein PrsA